MNEYDSDDLKPCPFCGCNAKIVMGIHGELSIECSNRNCGISFGSGIWVTSSHKKSIIEKWNSRVYITK